MAPVANISPLLPSQEAVDGALMMSFNTPRPLPGRVDLFSALALAAFVAGIAWLCVGFVSTGTFLQLVASFIAFYRARQRVLPHAVPPTMNREAELHDHNRIIPGGWMTASGPLILLAACAGYLWIRGGENPTPTNLDGHRLSVYLASTAGILASLTLILYGLAHWVRPVHAGGGEGARELKFRKTGSWAYFTSTEMTRPC
jgi:hypothetical protein